MSDRIAKKDEVDAAASTAATNLAAHELDSTGVHGIPDTSALVLTSDSRLANARTPTAHATSHQDGGTDELALDGSQVTTGTVADARIASTIARDSEVTAAVSAEATARDAAIASAVAALISGAPGALDTLNELAAAFGDDANFAATMTTALAGKQPLDADLTALAALASAANKMPYSTGAQTWALADLTAAGRALLDDADASAQRTTLGLGTAATHAHGDYDLAGAAAAAQAASQPVDSDLTAIAALSTTSYGRAFLALADAAAARTALALGTAATHATGDYDAAGAAAAAQAASQPLDSDLTAIAALTTTSFGRSLLAAADAAALRVLAGAVIGTNVQAWDADLDTLAANITAFGQSLVDDANAAAARSTLGLGTAATSSSTDFQPIDSDLTAIAALSTTSFGRSVLAAADAAALRTLAGLGTLATVDSPTPLANGGTAQTTAAAARGPSGLNIESLRTVADADATAVAADQIIAYTSLTANRTLTLPAANAVLAGKSVTVISAIASSTLAFNVVIARAGSDTINGATTSLTIPTAFGSYTLTSDGTSNWIARNTSSGTRKGMAAITNAGLLHLVGLSVTANGVPSAGVVHAGGGFAGLDFIATEYGNATACLDTRSFGGSFGAETASPSGTALGAWHIGGWGTTAAYDCATGYCITTQAMSDTQGGCKWRWDVTPNGTTTQVPAVTVDQDQSLILGGGLLLHRKAVANANYTQIGPATNDATHSSDCVIAYTSISAARVVTILSAAVAGAGFVTIVKDESGSCSVTNTITLTPASGTIDGAASKVLNTAFGVIRIYSNGTNWFTF